jgi:hypothetical protein
LDGEWPLGASVPLCEILSGKTLTEAQGHREDNIRARFRSPRSDLIFKSLPRSATFAAGLSWLFATSASNAEPAARAAVEERRWRRDNI